MAPTAITHCAYCGSAITGGGLVYSSTSGQVTAFCTKRCSKARPKLRHGSCPTSSHNKDAPLQAETGWASLSCDVLRHLAAHHLGLRERTVAALTCAHWRDALTQGVKHVDFEADEASCREVRAGGAEAACRVLDSARALMPQVESMSVSAIHKVMQPGALLRQLHAVSRWTRLRQLRITWDTQLLNEQPLLAEWMERQRLLDPAAAAAFRLPRMPRPQDSRLCCCCVGALGRLTGLQSLSISANLDDTRPLGLYGLSSLEHLTSLEVIDCFPVSERESHPSDSDLLSLTSLRRLSLSASLLSPLLLRALPQLGRLTQLVLHVADLPQAASALCPELDRMQNLRSIHICPQCDGEPITAATATEASNSLVLLAQGLKALADAQAERRQEEEARQQRQKQQQQQQPARRAAVHQPQPQLAAATPRQQHSRNRRTSRSAPILNPATTTATSTARGSPGESTTHVAAAASTVAPLEVHLDFGLPRDPLSLALTGELVDALCDLGPALRHLEVGFHDGAANNLYRLTELTALTHLALRCSHACRLDLAAWDLKRLATACPQLHTLRLALPADRMAACVTGLAAGSGTSGSSGDGGGNGSGGGGGFHRLRVLELQSYRFVREVPASWAEVRDMLEELLRGGGKAGGDSAAAGRGKAEQQEEQEEESTSALAEAPAAPLATAAVAGLPTGAFTPVAAADAAPPNQRPQQHPQQHPQLQQQEQQQQQQQQERMALLEEAHSPLLGLQQLFAAMEGLKEVRAALADEAEWRAAQRKQQRQRQRHLQQAAAAAAAGDGAHGGANDTDNGVVGAAAVDGGLQGLQRAAAFAVPRLPAWMLAPLLLSGRCAVDTHKLMGPESDEEEEGEEAGSANAAIYGGRTQAQQQQQNNVELTLDRSLGGSAAAAAPAMDAAALPSTSTAQETGAVPPSASTTSTSTATPPLAAAAAHAAPRAQGVPLHRLGTPHLAWLRQLLIREDRVAGPAFRLDAWTPQGLQCLRLSGFAGLRLGAVVGLSPSVGLAGQRAEDGRDAGGTGGVQGRGNVVSDGAEVGRRAAAVPGLEELEEVEVEVLGGPKEQAVATERLAAWLGGGARPRKVRVLHLG